MNRGLRIISVWAALALPAAPAGAHEFWLAPSAYVSAPGKAIEISAIAGTGFRGAPKPWSPAHCVRFLARAARMLDLTRVASPGDLAWARFAQSDAGGAMLAFESGFTPIELPAAQFNAYLESEGLDGSLAARRRAGGAAPGRERYRRAAKVWLAGHAVERATSPVGLSLEIVPLSIPGSQAILRAQVLWKGHPLPGSLVKAWRAPLGSGGAVSDAATRDSTGVGWRGRTDPRGEVAVPVAQAGEWLLSVVHMEPCAERSEADWESTWASLTFERAATVTR